MDSETSPTFSSLSRHVEVGRTQLSSNMLIVTSLYADVLLYQGNQQVLVEGGMHPVWDHTQVFILTLYSEEASSE